jgi:hypothetical protein
MTVCRHVVGAQWDRLPEAIRRLHGGFDAAGEGRVFAADTVLLRALARLLGFPRPAEAVSISLHVAPRRDGEAWRRRFGSTTVETRVALRDGLFAERFRGVEVRFALAASPQGLVFEQRRAALALGPLRLPLPPALAPRIEAFDEPGPLPSSVRFTVQIRLRGRRLVGYAGVVSLGDPS